MALISKHFDLNEFTTIDLSQEKLYLITALANNILDPLREFWGCPVTITSSVRTAADYQRLIDAGYHPSETSDHFYSNSIPIFSPDKIKIWGANYTCGVGAADLVPACGADVAWAKIQPYFNRDNKSIDLPSGSILVGQVIHEFGSGTNWVHCANPPTLKFSADFVNKFLNRICFLTSADKGISYQAA